MEIPGIVEIPFKWRDDDGIKSLSLHFRQMSLRDELYFKEMDIEKKLGSGDFKALLEGLLSLMTVSSKRKLNAVKMVKSDDTGDLKKIEASPIEKLLCLCGDNPWQANFAFLRCSGLTPKETTDFIETNKAAAEKESFQVHKKKMQIILNLIR